MCLPTSFAGVKVSEDWNQEQPLIYLEPAQDGVQANFRGSSHCLWITGCIQKDSLPDLRTEWLLGNFRKGWWILMVIGASLPIRLCSILSSQWPTWHHSSALTSKPQPPLAARRCADFSVESRIGFAAKGAPLLGTDYTTFDILYILILYILYE